MQHANPSDLAVTTETHSWCARLDDFVAIHLVKDAKKMVADVHQERVTHSLDAPTLSMRLVIPLEQLINLGLEQLLNAARSRS